MEDFVVSARKYRPATFKSVVGQEAIVNTLKNAIANHHLAQSFLFCGTRGVGKTSCARILAKTINCQNLTADIEACNQCESCKSFNDGRSLNIHELDAASNNSVDDIRGLIEQVRFAPQLGNFKVYIIDEVHMLSQAAFNAFLKTLEEPPAHAIFILATTEKHKIIPTILSRCQTFDFKRIQLKDVAKHLAYISTQEHVEADPEALHIIAEKADGSMRDALSIYDQMVSFAGKQLTYKKVIDNLNILDYDYYFKITENILNADVASTLLVFNEILANGFDGHLFIGGMGEHFRNLIVGKNPATAQLLEKGGTLKERYVAQAGQYPESLLFTGLTILNQCDVSYKMAVNQRLLVEITLIKLCALSPNSKTPIATSTVPEVKVVPKASAAAPAAPTPVKPAATVAKPIEATPVAPPKVEAPPPVVKKVSLPSVSKMMGEKPSAQASSQTTQAQPPAAPLVDEAIVEFWKEYINIHKEKKFSLCATLSQAVTKKSETEGSVIDVTVGNSVQQKSIDEDRNNLTDFLRTKLKHTNLRLNIIISKTETPHKPYTQEEKFQHMKGKNPEVEDLQNQLGLGLDM